MKRIAKILTSRTFQVLLVILYILIIISFFTDSVEEINHLKSYRTVLIFVLLGFQVINTQFSTKDSPKLVKTMTDEESEIVENLINVGENVKAIKKIREYTNLDLVKANQLYEELKDDIDKKN